MLPPVDAAPDALDTSQFSDKVVLWLDAADAVVTSGRVSSWPDHKNLALQTTVLDASIVNTACTNGNGIHIAANAINGKPSATFCSALLTVADDASIQLGTSDFAIEAVIRMATAAAGGLVLTKAHQGAAASTTIAFWGKNASGQLEGDVSSSEAATGMGSMAFDYVGFTRGSDKIVIRVEGQAGSSTSITPSDDVSSSGNPYQIGGSVFDVGVYANIFSGELAELLVLKAPTNVTVGLVELYLKAKYGLP